ncbi:MAG TPA: beta-propeller fold lactonase family protein, partial [Catalimonadaceae bacterium]|nr:beta-propeller fold lactonase family protein [Catalimonadaceae bacterium]
MPNFKNISLSLLVGTILGISGLTAYSNPSLISDGSGTKVTATSLYRTIASLRGVNASGVADSLNKLVVITGTVHTINFRPNGLEFGLSDFSGGMHVFKSTNLVPAYGVTYGDSIRVRGTITQFRGLTQIVPDSISLLQNNRDVKTPKLVPQLTESTESQLLRLEDLKLTSNSLWGGTGSYTAKALKGTNTTDTVYIRIDSDALITYNRPTGPFNLIGHGGQFAPTTSAPFVGGYQILPRGNYDFSLPYQAGVVYAYVANISSDNVSVINTSTNTVSATIPVGKGPGGIAVSPNGTRIYTTNQGSFTVSVVDAASQSVIEQIPIGYLPVSVTVSPDGNRVYVASYTAGYVTVINAVTNKIISRIFISQDVSSIAVSPDGSKLYAASTFEGKIVVLNSVNFSVLTQITIGTICYNLAMSPDGTRLYATRYGENILTIINTATNLVTANVNLGSSADGVAVSPNGSRVYVSNMGSNEVTVVNTATNSVLTTIPISPGISPDGISVHPDGSKVYVSNPGSDNVSIINTVTNQVINTVAVGSGPYSTGNFMPLVFQVPCVSPTFSPNSLSNGTVGALYNQSITQTGLVNPIFSVTSGSLPPGFTLSPAGELSGNPTGSGTYSFTITATAGICTGNKAYTMNINPNPGLVLAYLPNLDSDSVAVINTTSNSVFTKIKVGSTPVGVSVSPDGSRAYISNQNSDNVSVINTSTNAVVATISVGNAPNDLLVSPDGNRLYVLNYLGSSVSVINTATNSVLATINTPGNPKGVSILPDGSKLYVGHVFDGVISVINTATNSIINSIPSFERPTALAVNPTGTRLYAGHALSNNVRVFNTATNTLVENISMPGGVSGIAVSLDGSRLYVTNNDASDFVTIINTSTNSIISSIATGIFPTGISLTPDGSKLLVARADWTTGGASVISTVSNSIVANIPIQGPYYAYGNSMPLKYVACPTVAISPSSLPTATTGSVFSQSLSQTGLSSATFSLTNGSLPAGLTLSSSGQIGGTPTVSGTFTFTASANLGNCGGSKTYNLTVNCLVLASPAILGNLSFCTGGNTTLSVDNPQANTTYLWSTGTIANSIQVASGGTFSVRAISYTCTSATSQPVNISVTPLPNTPTVTGALSFCAGESSTLSVENPQANHTYIWNNGSTGSAITVTAPGSYSVRAISNACTSAVSQPSSVSVTPLPNTPTVTGALSF